MRQQCWVNEFLTSLDWCSENDAPHEEEEEKEAEAIDDDALLEALLNGSFKPRCISVLVSIPVATESAVKMLFNAVNEVVVRVSLDVSRPKGVRVEVEGKEGTDESVLLRLEEVCRRGGGFTLPGRLVDTA